MKRRFEKCYNSRMFSREQVSKLAELARIAVSEEEKESLRGDLEAIVSCVSAVAAAPAGDAPPLSELRSVLREDGEPHAAGAFTEALLAQAPAVERGYVKVKAILARGEGKAL